MTELNVSARSLGVNFNEVGTALVTVWAPLAEKVAIKTKNAGDILLEKGEYGYWGANDAPIKPGDLYKIALDGDKELPDPASLSQPEGVHGHSQAIDIRSFEWSDIEWNNLPLKDYLIYELHTGTFSEKSSFAGIEEKLDYLIELGVTAIEIMPVAQFPGSRNWGYDGVLPYAVQDSYGGAEGLQHLVNACHNKGLAVILDVVYNHIGPEGNYLGSFGKYFTDKYHTPWGDAINFDDAWCDGVRRYFIENALMWFRDFHIDALRMDAVHAIKDLSPTHLLQDIRLHVDKLMEETGRKHYLIVECDLNDTRFINQVDKDGGFGMDGQWIDEFHHALRVASGQEQSGYYADFDGLAHLAKAYKDAYVYDGQYSPHRNKRFGVKADDNGGQQFVVFSQNHDQVGNRMLGERTSQLVSYEMQKLMAGAVLVSPFLLMLFMGEEYAESNPFLYFISHTDPQLVEAVRKGRKAEFAAFHALGEAPDPQAEETFNSSRLQWKLLGQEPHRTMFEYYKALISLRKELPALSNCNRHQLDVSHNEEKKTLVLHRWDGGVHALCIMNFSQQEQHISVSSHNQQWEKVFDSADTKWRGPKAALPTVKGGAELTLQPESILIYTNTHV
ncbi:MAG: malto-oligosyltrehalose trehalohydrolase [Sphingobacteriales bacterium]|nr:MAG: malto-oligosyltrehalose trehalohydrolase [Sphingobacteriales bacterium]